MCGGGGGGGNPSPPPAPKPVVTPTPAPKPEPTPVLSSGPGVAEVGGKAIGERMSSSLGKSGRAASILTGGRGDLSMPEIRSGKDLLGR